MKHIHKTYLTGVPASGTRVLCRQTNGDEGHDEGVEGEVEGTIYGVVVALDSISPLKIKHARDKGYEPWFVVRWDRATDEHFEMQSLDLITKRNEPNCIQIDENEEYAKCPTPEVNAKATFAKYLGMAREEYTKIVADEGGTHIFTEGQDPEAWIATGVFQALAQKFGMSTMFGGRNDSIDARVLRLAAEHLVDVTRKAN